jgi:hypothetical protein
MPRHCAPNHTDCCVNCPNGGYAVYFAPRGPCKTKCDPESFGNLLYVNVVEFGWNAKSSGKLIGFTGAMAFAMTFQLSSLARDDFQAREALDLLRGSAERQLDVPISAAWLNGDIYTVLHAIREQFLPPPKASQYEPQLVG